jgi:hypothetical protein
LKTLFTFLFIAFLTPLTVFSQQADSLGIKRLKAFNTYSIQGGLNISWLSNLNYVENRLGAQVGFSAERRFSKVFGVATELNYSQQGVTTDNIEIGLNYLKMPLLLTLHDHNVTVQGGVFGAVLLKAKATAGKISEKVTDHFNETDAGICLGLRVNSFGPTFIGARFYQGLQDINKGAVTPKVELKSSTVQITAGYTFQ